MHNAMNCACIVVMVVIIIPPIYVRVMVCTQITGNSIMYIWQNVFLSRHVQGPLLSPIHGPCWAVLEAVG